MVGAMHATSAVYAITNPASLRDDFDEDDDLPSDSLVDVDDDFRRFFLDFLSSFFDLLAFRPRDLEREALRSPSMAWNR